MKIESIKTDGQATLVEAVVKGKVYRRLVPSHLVREDNEIEPSDFERGVDYGVPFAEIITPRVISAEEFETALHNAGIWTAEDVQSKSREALGALQLVYGVDLGNILKATQEHVETKKSETAKKPAITKRKTSKKEEDNA